MQSAAEIEIAENVWPCQTDLLKRHEEIELLTPMLLGMPSPAVMALDAPWGQGKTTFIRLWQEYLRQQGLHYVSFNAWESDFAADPLVPMLAAFDKWLKDNTAITGNTQDWSKLKKLGGKILKAGAVTAIKLATMGVVDASEAAEELLAAGAGDAAGSVIDEFNEQIEALDQFHRLLTEVVGSLPAEQPNLIVFIDELDRCRPTYAIELLERIKHLFNIPRIVFVLGMDSGQLSESIKAVYGSGFDATQYLKRFFDFDYRIKTPNKSDYINAIINTSLLTSYFKVGQSRSYDREQFVKCLGVLSERFSIDLRSINQLVTRISLMLSPDDGSKYCDAPLLAVLLVLRHKNELLYRKYIENPDFADEVMDYISEGMSFNSLYSDEMATMTSFVIAGSYRELDDKRLAELQGKYLSILENPVGADPNVKHFVNRVIELSSWLRRGRECSKGPKVAFERIELVYSIGISR